MIVRKRKTVTIEVEVEVAAEWSGESGGGKPTERWIEDCRWTLVRPRRVIQGDIEDDYAHLCGLIDDAVASITEEELAE